MKKIGMIVAMDTELREYFATLSEIKKLDNTPYSVWTTEIYGKQLFIVKSGVGEIAAAGGAQYLITQFKVDVVINFGICGKLSSNLKLLDTVVVNSVVHYQFDTSAIDPYPAGRYEQFDSEFIKADCKLIDLLLQLDGSIKQVICASGDLFVAKQEDKERLIKLYNADICEMETAGILITCKKNGIPCLMVKSVSDDCDGMDFMTYCKIASAKHVELIDKFVKIF